MKGDISADFHDPTKLYTGVRGQQGRVLTDADFNAAFDVVEDAMERLVRNLICAAGTPDGGLEITAPSTAVLTLADGANVDTLDFNIAPGSFVLGGRTLIQPGPESFLDQDDWLSQQLDASVFPPAPTAADLLASPSGARHDLAYLEMIGQPVRAVEDREIQERALGGADTTTRVRPQLKVRVHEDTADECVVAAASLRATLAGATASFSADGTELHSNARLSISFTNLAPTADPCAPREDAGYLGAENQMLKIMLSAPDRFVWNFDHGEPLYRVQVDEGTSEILFLTEPRDPLLYPRPGQVIEILPWDVVLPNREKAAAPLGHLSPLTSEYDPSTGRIGFATPLPAGWAAWLAGLPASVLSDDPDNQRFFYARIWQEPPSGGGVDEAIGAGVVLPDTGLSLTFIGNGIPGDYWHAALRPDTPELIVPWALQDAAGDAPAGPRRFYAPLGLITWSLVAGNVVGTVADCRNRFRRLCHINSCCTYQVGDGRSSFGEFNDIQAAVDALPAEGGEICLLPGRHEGLVNLIDRRNIRIHGCGPRTIVTAPPGATGPVFRISGGRFIQLDSFTVFHNEGLAIHGLDRTRDVTLRELNLRAIGTAVLFTSAISLVIERCDIRSGLLPAALQTTTALDLRPLVYLAGLGLHVIENVLRADSVSARNRIALGGLQIAGGSREVRIRGNKILGGNGNGITLGSVTTRVDPGTGDSTGYQIPPWITIDADGCIQINPGGGVRPDPGSPPTVTVFSEGPVEDLHIRRNEIRDMGMSGISTAHWFIPIENNAIDVDDDMEIEDAVIASNWIENCMLLDLVAGLPPEIAFASAFGGIVLSGAINLQIEDNDIRECGTRGRTPICGIYVRYGEILHITGNRIYDNGRASTLSDLLLVGIIGGIVVSMVESGLETAAERHDFGAQPRAPAIFVKDNVVVSPEGRALDVRGTGPMLIEGNSLTCYGNNGLLILVLIFLIVASNPAVGAPLLASPLVQGQLQAIMGQLGGSAVLIHNLGVPQNLTLFGGGRKSTLAFTGNIRVIPAFPVATPRLPNLRGAVVGGEVQFSDNIVTFDALSNAATVSLCSVLIVSYDDVGMHDNQSTVELRGDVVLINTIAAGFLSARVQGNRFKETLPQRRGVTQPFPVTTFLSAMTFGLMNATENNQGTHCFLRLGLKKPRVMPNPDPTSDLVPIWLDTNRNFVPDQLCSALDELNYVIGARGRTS